MLYGFAIENVLKGLAVRRNPQLISQEKLDKLLKNHDLLELAATAAFASTAEDRPVLEALTNIVRWAGRYPFAARIKEYGSWV